MEEDFEFALDCRVVVGTQPGKVTGQAKYRHREDEFLISFIDDDGFPFERWFSQHAIEKARVQ